MPKASPDEPSDDDVAQRRDEVVKRMLATPPQPRAAKPKKEREPKPAPRQFIDSGGAPTNCSAPHRQPRS